MLSDGCRGTGATLIGALVTGVRVTPMSGFSVGDCVHGSGCVYAGAESVSSVGGGGRGGGGRGGGWGVSIGVGCVLGAVGALVDAFGETDVDSPGLLAGLLGHTSMTTGTAKVADAAAISAIRACLVRYHGGGALNVKALLLEARS